MEERDVVKLIVEGTLLDEVDKLTDGAEKERLDRYNGAFFNELDLNTRAWLRNLDQQRVRRTKEEFASMSEGDGHPLLREVFLKCWDGLSSNRICLWDAVIDKIKGSLDDDRAFSAAKAEFFPTSIF